MFEMNTPLILVTNFINSLTHFMPLSSFYTPWKYQKTSDFLMFSGGIEGGQCNEVG